MRQVLNWSTGLSFLICPFIFYGQNYVDTSITIPYKFTVTRTVSGQRTITARLPIIRDTIYIRDTVYHCPDTIPETPITDILFKVSDATVYLKWDTVQGAQWYDVYRDGELITQVTSGDTWDMLNPLKSDYEIIPKDTINTTYPIIKGTVDGNGNTFSGAVIEGDYRRISGISVTDGVVSGHPFKTSDIGKTIGIAGTRDAKWYREAPLWGHYTITNVLPDGSAMINGLPLNATNTHGWYATNHYNEWKQALEAGAGINGFDTVYIDGPTVSVDKPQTILGNFVFGREDMIANSITDPTPAYTVIDHKAAVLFIAGSIRGPLTVPLRNQSNRAFLAFYKRNTETPQNCELHFTGVFGDSTNYRTGFINFASNTHSMADSGKDVIAIYDSRIYCSEPFELRPYTTNSSRGTVTDNWGKRMLLRDVYFGGSAFVKFVGPVRGNVSGNTITVDSTKYPSFTFRELYPIHPWSQYIIYKKPETPPGPINQFENSLIKQTTKTNGRYSVTVTDNTMSGEIDLLATSDMQPTIPWEGHLIYTHAACEIEIQNVHIYGIRSLFIRMSDAPEYKGQFHRQLSVNDITWTPSDDDSFDAINQFGGYVQFKLWPQPFYELQTGMKTPGIIFRNTTQKYQGGPPLIIRQ